MATKPGILFRALLSLGILGILTGIIFELKLWSAFPVESPADFNALREVQFQDIYTIVLVSVIPSLSRILIGIMVLAGIRPKPFLWGVLLLLIGGEFPYHIFFMLGQGRFHTSALYSVVSMLQGLLSLAIPFGLFACFRRYLGKHLITRHTFKAAVVLMISSLFTFLSGYFSGPASVALFKTALTILYHIWYLYLALMLIYYLKDQLIHDVIREDT